MKSLIAILSVAIILLFCAVDLSAQEKKEGKRWEITGYFGGGGAATEGGYGSTFAVPCFGLGLEYFITDHISLDGEINYLPNIGWPPGAPYSRDDITFTRDRNYRLLCDINLLFYTAPTVSKRPVRLFITLGTGYMYDHAEHTVFSNMTQEQYKYGTGKTWFQYLIIGGGLRIKIKDHWALKLIYKIHRCAGDEKQTNRLALGLSYRF